MEHRLVFYPTLYKSVVIHVYENGGVNVTH
nr:MAG TPA: hypothetical protein [Caudoviricetes sp.]